MKRFMQKIDAMERRAFFKLGAIGAFFFTHKEESQKPPQTHHKLLWAWRPPHQEHPDVKAAWISSERPKWEKVYSFWYLEDSSKSYNSFIALPLIEQMFHVEIPNYPHLVKIEGGKTAFFLPPRFKERECHTS